MKNLTEFPIKSGNDNKLQVMLKIQLKYFLLTAAFIAFDILYILCNSKSARRLSKTWRSECNEREKNRLKLHEKRIWTKTQIKITCRQHDRFFLHSPQSHQGVFSLFQEFLRKCHDAEKRKREKIIFKFNELKKWNVLTLKKDNFSRKKLESWKRKKKSNH